MSKLTPDFTKGWALARKTEALGIEKTSMLSVEGGGDSSEASPKASDKSVRDNMGFKGHKPSTVAGFPIAPTMRTPPPINVALKKGEVGREEGWD